MKLHLDYSNLKRIVVEAIIIVCFSIVIGLSFNYRMIMSAFEGEVIASVAEPVAGNDVYPVPVTLADVDTMMDRTVLVDARIEELYTAGHLPGAVSLPLAEIDAQLEAFKTEIPLARSLVVYCSGYGCSDSFELASVLIAAGYQDVMIYEGGFPEWRDAGRPISKGTP